MRETDDAEASKAAAGEVKKAVNLKLLKYGTGLLNLFIVLLLLGIIPAVGLFSAAQGERSMWLALVITAVILDVIVFWAGIILVYISSVQLGIKYRVAGIVLGWVPVINIVLFFRIVSICRNEIKTEEEKEKLNEHRRNEQICKTKYPILLVHGVFFRDFKVLNYWGRIPKELEKNGATIFYGQQHSAASVSDCAKELEKRISDIVRETGCEKLNVIAHSKGGLDTRAAIASTSAGSHIASLTTINTPHRGCEFADYFLGKMSESSQLSIAGKYNLAASKLGDENPDFISAVYDLTAASCAKFNEETPDSTEVFYQWVGSVQRKAGSGKFPLNLTHGIVKLFDGRNDGLVGEASFPWGEKYAFLDLDLKRGISHADMIDLNRENISGFDVREFYVQLVSSLKKRGF